MKKHCGTIDLESSQESWTKEYVSCANVVTNVGDRAIAALQRLESDGVHVNAGMLRRCFEGLSVPQDQQEAFRRLEEKDGKTTATVFADICNHIKSDRVWQWLLCHPDMTDDRVHPSRRVFLSMAACLFFSFIT